MNTLLLGTQTWDIGLDGQGNLAVAAGPAAIAQDVASACRTWFAELWYDTTRGVHYELILNERPPLQFIKQELIREGLQVPFVSSIAAFLTGPGQQRTVGGQLQITDSEGQMIAVVQATNLPGDLPWWTSGADEEAGGGTT